MTARQSRSRRALAAGVTALLWAGTAAGQATSTPPAGASDVSSMGASSSPPDSDRPAPAATAPAPPARAPKAARGSRQAASLPPLPEACGRPAPPLATDTRRDALLPPAGAAGVAAQAYAIPLEEGEGLLVIVDPDRATRMVAEIGMCVDGNYRTERQATGIRLAASSSGTLTVEERRRLSIGFTAPKAGRYLVQVANYDQEALVHAITTRKVAITPPTPVTQLVFKDNAAAGGAVEGAAAGGGTFTKATPQRIILGGYYDMYRVTLKKDQRYLISGDGLERLEVDIGLASGDFWRGYISPIAAPVVVLDVSSVLFVPSQDDDYLIRVHGLGDKLEEFSYKLNVELLKRTDPPAKLPEVVADKAAIDGTLIARDPLIAGRPGEFAPYQLFVLRGSRDESYTVTLYSEAFLPALDAGAITPLDVDFVAAVSGDLAEGATVMKLKFVKSGVVLLRISSGNNKIGAFRLSAVRDKREAAR